MVGIRRLIARSALIILLRRSISQSTPERALDPFILIRALLVPELPPRLSVTISLDSVAATTAAAATEHPEEACSQ